MWWAVLLACAPTAPTVVISPLSPGTEDRLTARVEGLADGVTAEFQWEKQGLPQSGQTQRWVSAEDTARGDVWRVKVRPTQGDPFYARVEIGNTPPGAPTVRVAPHRAAPGTALRCVVNDAALDPDGDVVTYEAAWALDGVAFDEAGTIGFAGDLVPEGVTALGQQWTCTATASDDDALGGSASGAATVTEAPGGNVLLIVADDLGIDKVAAYGEHPETPPTPTLDRLAAQGVLFRNAYARPVCSPTRGDIMTGRHGRRYGLGKIIHSALDEFELPLDETTLAHVAKASPVGTYATSAVGKWHLSAFDSPSAFDHPLLLGWDWYSGSLGNLIHESESDGVPNGYYHWQKSLNGVVFHTDKYATTDSVDDALDRIAAMPEPWLLYLALNAPHVPEHVPPEDLITLAVDEGSSGTTKFHATIEAMDTELGRLLDSVDPDVLGDTTVIFVGDNGTPDQFVTDPWEPALSKGTVYEPGVNVPLMITGPLVGSVGEESAALVHVVDLFATVAAIVGVDQPSDGVALLADMVDASLPSQREVVYVDRFLPNGDASRDTDQRMVRDARYKLVEYVNQERHELYDLQGRDYEGDDLLEGVLNSEQQQAYDRLVGTMDAIVADLAGEVD